MGSSPARHLARCLLLCCVGAVPLAQSGPQSTQPPPARFGADLENDLQRVPPFHSDLTGFVSYDMTDRKVVFQWKRTFSNGVRRRSYQAESVTFWPTAVAAGAEGVVYVAGKTVKGKTIIQRWQLDDDPDLLPAIETPEGVTYPDTSLEVQRSPMYREDIPGQRLVSVLFANRGLPGAFALFDDSRDLYHVDDEGTAILVMSASPSPSVEVQPDLAQDFTRVKQAHHAQYGYIYCLMNGSSSTFVLFDTDRNGVLDPDAARWVTAQEWHDQGFQQRSNYFD